MGYEVAVVAALSFPKKWVSQGTMDTENDLYAQTIALLASDWCFLEKICSRMLHSKILMIPGYI